MFRALIAMFAVTALPGCGEVIAGLPSAATTITVEERSFAVDGNDRLYLLSLGESEVRVREVVGAEPLERMTVPTDGVPRFAAGLVTSDRRAMEVVVDSCPEGYADPESPDFAFACRAEPKVARFRIDLERWSVVREDDLTDLGALAYPLAPTQLRLGRVGSDTFLDSGRNASAVLPEHGPPRGFPVKGCPVGDLIYGAPATGPETPTPPPVTELFVYDSSGSQVSTIPVPVPADGPALANIDTDCSNETVLVIQRWSGVGDYEGPAHDVIAFDGSGWSSTVAEGYLHFARGPISASMISVTEGRPIEGEVDLQFRHLLVDGSGVAGVVDEPDSIHRSAPVPLGFPHETVIVDSDRSGREFVVRSIAAGE